ncbi:hypothetical protein [Vibrio superstes]|uniref:Uncharacterized protein n=1 Tax=Vibrio superstes NBRC 103154 TaxID=1219062 RepID=A0A511QQD9_9VIBR|nr:hypothetical protein [Vibrio superstes]GEM79575.1 hypothetical protein VSU01S_18200 [Vibrio superstes NBRC 103154]
MHTDTANVVAFDWDCVKMRNVEWLHENENVYLVSVSNDVLKLPVIENRRVGTVVPLFGQSADFFIISELSRIITDCKLTNSLLPVFHVVTQDKSLSLGAKYLCSNNKAQCHIHTDLRGLALHL